MSRVWEQQSSPKAFKNHLYESLLGWMCADGKGLRMQPTSGGPADSPVGRARTQNGLDFPIFQGFCPIPSLREWKRNKKSYFDSGSAVGVTVFLSSANHATGVIDTVATNAADRRGLSKSARQRAGTCKRNTDRQTTEIDSGSTAVPNDLPAVCLIKVPKRPPAV